MGRLRRQFDETGQVRRKGCNVPIFPARALDVMAAEPDDQHGADHGDDFVNGLERIFPEIGQNHFLFVVGQVRFIAPVLDSFFAVDAVRQGVADAVQGHARQGAAAFLAAGCRRGDQAAQAVGQGIGDGREDENA